MIQNEVSEHDSHRQMTLLEAINEHKKTRLMLYKRSSHEIKRDVNSAKHAAKDHIGRWLFELLQNCDDAGATKVHIVLDGDTFYIADNGSGLKPEAVSAICGTDLSDKGPGTIGRKGVGFKSVYEVTSRPAVITVGGLGIEFCPEKTKDWLRENGLPTDRVPFPWIPFPIDWDVARQQHPRLRIPPQFQYSRYSPGCFLRPTAIS